MRALGKLTLMLLPGRGQPSAAALLCALTACALPLFACTTGGGESETISGSPNSDSAAPTAAATPGPRALTSLDLPVRVAVTLPIFEDFVRLAGGDHVDVISIVPSGSDPKTYVMTAEDIELLEGVEFFYLNGLGLDDHLRDSIEERRDETSHVIPFAPNVRSPTSAGEYATTAGDEAHLWLDPDLAAIYVAIIADEFVIYDEVNRSFYDTRFRQAVDALKMFGDELAAELAVIAPDRRKIVAPSGALTHIARRFGFSLVRLASEPAQNESRAETVQRLKSVVEEQAVPAVFAEYRHDNSIIEEVAAEAGVQLCTLYTDIAPSVPMSYEDLMRANVAELIRCLAE